MNRREMLELTGAIAAGMVYPARRSAAQGYPANETISVGCIGTGGRCRRLVQSLRQVEGVRITAICDVWDKHLEMMRELAEPGAFETKYYHAVLARDDIDAVVIASPDHWHVPMTIDACRAGKDVYVEKPLTHDLSEGAGVIEAVRGNKRIVQVGTQQRSMPHIRRAYEIVKSGRLGRIHKAHLTWNRNHGRAARGDLNIDPRSVDWKRFLGSAPDQPFDEYRFRHWRWFWDFGGGTLTDLMVHWIDVVHWFCDLEHPQEAVAIGDHFMAKDVWETPDTMQTLIRFPEQELQVYFEGTFINARNAAMCEFMGTEATLYIDRGRYEVYPEKGKGEVESMVLGSGPKGADFYDEPDGELLHLTNWIDCVRSRKEPNAPIEAGVHAATGAHLGNIAYREKKLARWK